MVERFEVILGQRNGLFEEKREIIFDRDVQSSLKLENELFNGEEIREKLSNEIFDLSC